MNRGDSPIFRNRKPIADPCRVTDAVLYDAVVRLGREITQQTAIAERQGDYQTVEQLLREKNRVHRLRRELSHVSR